MNSDKRPIEALLLLPARGSRIVIGLSGGADSVCLTHLLCGLREKMDYRLLAAHVNHGIRGAEADRDEAFCRAFCEGLSLPIEVLRADVPKLAAETRESGELCGRRLRYAFFEELAGPDGIIVTAHNSDDSAETVLWNLIRGTGMRGLCGIPALRKNICRPLLRVPRAQIEDYCRRNRLSFVTDSTNLEDCCTRNKIRGRIMPLLRELNPSVALSIARLSELAAQDEAALGGEAEAFRTENYRDNSVSERALSELSPAVRRRVIFKILSELCGKEVAFVHVSAVESILKTGKKITCAGSLIVRSRAGRLEFLKGESVCAPFSVPADLQTGCLEYPYGSVKIFRITAKDLQNLNKELLDNAADCAKINSVLFLRSRRGGDVFQSARGYSKSLKKLFSEAKIPPEKRSAVAVLSDGERVVWAEGFGTAGPFRTDESSKDIVIFQKTNEWGKRSLKGPAGEQDERLSKRH